jgi:hypothetical protein
LIEIHLRLGNLGLGKLAASAGAAPEVGDREIVRQ